MYCQRHDCYVVKMISLPCPKTEKRKTNNPKPLKQIKAITNLLTPRNDQGDLSDSISQSNEI